MPGQDGGGGSAGGDDDDDDDYDDEKATTKATAGPAGPTGSAWGWTAAATTMTTSTTSDNEGDDDGISRDGTGVLLPGEKGRRGGGTLTASLRRHADDMLEELACQPALALCLMSHEPSAPASYNVEDDADADGP